MKKTKIKTDPVKGRGVYAREPIKKKESIEVCELIVLDFKEVGEKLEAYVFDFNEKKAALALGNGSLYNHSDNPNAICFLDTEECLLSFEALRSIRRGEEITIDYGYTSEERKRFHIV